MRTRRCENLIGPFLYVSATCKQPLHHTSRPASRSSSHPKHKKDPLSGLPHKPNSMLISSPSAHDTKTRRCKDLTGPFLYVSATCKQPLHHPCRPASWSSSHPKHKNDPLSGFPQKPNSILKSSPRAHDKRTRRCKDLTGRFLYVSATCKQPLHHTSRPASRSSSHPKHKNTPFPGSPQNR